MVSHNKIALYLILPLLMIGLVSAVQVCELYDDFSSNILDLNKWEEIPGSDVNSLFVDEYFINSDEGVYHTAQLSGADRGISLRIKNKTFVLGDMVEYDVYYVSGSGNRISVVELDGDYKWLGQIGYWNGGDDAFGLYHFKIEFDNQGANVIIIKPDETSLTKRLDSLGETHTFGFGTRTGHNGVVHMDYDNVVICSEQEEKPEPGLEERIKELEEENEELKNEISLFKEIIERMRNFIDSLPKGIREHWRK